MIATRAGGQPWFPLRTLPSQSANKYILKNERMTFFYTNRDLIDAIQPQKTCHTDRHERSEWSGVYPLDDWRTY